MLSSTIHIPHPSVYSKYWRSVTETTWKAYFQPYAMETITSQTKTQKVHPSGHKWLNEAQIKLWGNSRLSKDTKNCLFRKSQWWFLNVYYSNMYVTIRRDRAGLMQNWCQQEGCIAGKEAASPSMKLNNNPAGQKCTCSGTGFRLEDSLREKLIRATILFFKIKKLQKKNFNIISEFESRILCWMPREQSQKNFTNFNWCLIKHIIITELLKKLKTWLLRTPWKNGHKTRKNVYLKIY